MRSIRVRTTVESTTLDLPELAPLVGRRVEVTVRDEGADTWPEGWFEKTAGAIQDPTFVRPTQPSPEGRTPIDP
jgi:hypothetical protein